MLHDLCQLLFDHVDIAAAEEPLKRLLAMRPRDASSHHNLGLVYRKTGRIPEAIAAFRQALLLRPNYVLTLRELARTLDVSGQLREAKLTWSEVLRLQPGDDEALAMVG